MQGKMISKYQAKNRELTDVVNKIGMSGSGLPNMRNVRSVIDTGLRKKKKKTKKRVKKNKPEFNGLRLPPGNTDLMLSQAESAEEYNTDGGSVGYGGQAFDTPDGNHMRGRKQLLRTHTKMCAVQEILGHFDEGLMI